MTIVNNPSKLLLYLLLTFVIGSSLGSCSTGTLEPTNANLGLEYFPLEVGSYIDYQVEDIQFTILNPPDTNRYQIRELIKDEFTDIEGNPAFRLERYRRANANASWILDSVWQAKRSTTQAIVVQNNKPIVKLIFPLEDGIEWVGTVFFRNKRKDTIVDTTTSDTSIVETFIGDRYKVTNFNQPFTLGSLTFDSTLTVIQSDDSSRVGIDQRKEMYAANVGLIYKDSTVVTYCDPSVCSFPEIDFGRKSRQIIIGFGKL
ncbi:hypothetical protein BKI52_07550 [marine bacterium AO1-C]|nr:hypothetical protein BKI52_07550 [marine bacterium AO1-C]